MDRDGGRRVDGPYHMGKPVRKGFALAKFVKGAAYLSCSFHFGSVGR
jgi:hypothetical protein